MPDARSSGRNDRRQSQPATEILARLGRGPAPDERDGAGDAARHDAPPQHGAPDESPDESPWPRADAPDRPGRRRAPEGPFPRDDRSFSGQPVDNGYDGPPGNSGRPGPPRGTPQPGHSQPGRSQPGRSLPGHSLPGHSLPGHSLPGRPQPGHSQSGHHQPGNHQPGAGRPGTPTGTGPHGSPTGTNPGHRPGGGSSTGGAPVGRGGDSPFPHGPPSEASSPSFPPRHTAPGPTPLRDARSAPPLDRSRSTQPSPPASMPPGRRRADGPPRSFGSPSTAQPQLPSQPQSAPQPRSQPQPPAGPRQTGPHARPAHRPPDPAARPPAAPDRDATQVARTPDRDATQVVRVPNATGGRAPVDPNATRAVRPTGSAGSPGAVGSADPDATRAVRAPVGVTGSDATSVVRTPTVTGPGKQQADRLPGERRPQERQYGEQAPQQPVESEAVRAKRIDETLSRLTAAHAGLTLAARDDDDEKKDDRPPPPPPAPPTPPLVRIGRIAVAVVAVLVFAVTALQYLDRARLDDAVRTVAALDPGSGAIIDAEAQEGAENVLVLSTDTAGTNDGPRADTVLLVHVPAGGGDVIGVGIPRALEVNRPPCERWEPTTGEYLTEIEPAQARTPLITAYDVGGPRCATRVIQQLTGLAVTRFVGLDLGAVAGLVDAVGGVEICTPRPVVDEVLGEVVATPGTVRLDGEQARDFARARTVAGDPPADRGALERQHRLLTAVLSSALSPGVLLNPSRTGALAGALAAAVSADGAGLDQVLAVSGSLDDLDADGVTFASVPTSGETSGQGNPVLRDADAAALFAALREGEPLPELSTDLAAASSGPAPSDVTVQILNASDQPGLASEIGTTLGALGFGLGEVGNAETPTTETVIRFSPDRAAGAALLGRTVPSATAVPDPGASGVLQLVLGRSFDGVVRAPTVGPPEQAGSTGTAPTTTCG